MKRKNLFVRISLALTLLLLVAAVFVGCGTPEETVSGTVYENAEKIGEGTNTFVFIATFEDKTSKVYEVSTDAETVGEALTSLDLIDGEVGQFGLTVETVCGVTVDFGADSSYWAIYVDGDYAMTGIDSIKCTDVKEVELRFEKF
ncbi:MAG: DUF4430 domain-containing protein [Ruminococcaceae bacterium]|nr:DUF4430 domain-containing protein [Oscillospiraceae bacterium]